MVRIRRAAEAELDEIAELDRVCFPADKPVKPEGLSPWWVASEEGAIVGYAGAYDSPLFPGFLYYHRVGVIPDCRGRGIHPRLTRTVQRYARKHGYAGIVTDVASHIPASLNGFAGCGFRAFWPDPPVNPWALGNSVYLRWTV